MSDRKAKVKAGLDCASGLWSVFPHAWKEVNRGVGSGLAWLWREHGTEQSRVGSRTGLTPLRQLPALEAGIFVPQVPLAVELG